MSDLSTAFKGKKIFLTGHTGFKGSWLLQILHLLGADVKGYALSAENDKDLYNQLQGDRLCYASVIGDIRDEHVLKGELVRFEPDFVFHLAAQSLVRRSYEQPMDTFSVNVMGTINVLNALRSLEKPCAALMITTDKVYENKEGGQAFKETDPLGGLDPYSSSKAAAEMAIASFRNAYFPVTKISEHHKSIVALRAGNVIGGGDYSEDRIIPDIVRSIEREETVMLRNPHAIRPWQHVLEPLFAYLLVAAKMAEHAQAVSPAYNIGPDKQDALDVETVTKKFIHYFGKGSYGIAGNAQQPHEAQTLILDNKQMKREMGWVPKYNATDAIRLTANWYADKEKTASEKTIAQINNYLAS